MKRLDAVLGTLALGAASTARTQAPGRTYHIGFLHFASGKALAKESVWHAFVQRLRALGYRDGGNLVIEQRFADVGSWNYAEFAIEMAKLKPDAVVVSTVEMARSVMALSRAIPIVAISLAGDPVRSGLATNLAQPSGQVTGISDFSDELVPKRLELFKAAVPSAKRVAYARCPQCSRQAGLSMRELEVLYAEQENAALSLGMTLVPADLSSNANFDDAAAIVRRERADALLIGTTRFNVELRDRWLAFAAQQRLPTFASYRDYGAMLSYGPDVAAIYVQAAELVAKILRGARPGELPMEQPTGFTFTIDLKQAKAMGITIPQSVLLRADEVIQ